MEQKGTSKDECDKIFRILKPFENLCSFVTLVRPIYSSGEGQEKGFINPLL